MIDEQQSHGNYYESGQRAVSLLKRKGVTFLHISVREKKVKKWEDHIAGFLDAVWDEGISYREECVQGIQINNLLHYCKTIHM